MREGVVVRVGEGEASEEREALGEARVAEGQVVCEGVMVRVCHARLILKRVGVVGGRGKEHGERGKGANTHDNMDNLKNNKVFIHTPYG